MARGSKIRWRKSDTDAVRKLVSKFNAKITRTSKKSPALAAIQPDRRVVQDTVKRFQSMSRAEVKREMGAMERYLRKGAEMPYTTKAGVNTTIWQKREVDNTFRSINAQRRAMVEKYKPSSQTGSMHAFRSQNLNPRANTVETIQPKMWDKYLENLAKQSIANSSQARFEQYKNNYLTAIERELGRNNLLYEKANQIPAERLVEYYYTSPVLQIDFIYDPKEAEEIIDRMVEEIERLESLR